MNLLYIAHGGFGDVAFTTSWPKTWAAKGFTVDIMLMLYTGNPFHKNPYVRNLFISHNSFKNDLESILSKNSYDKVVLIENNNLGMQEVMDVLKSKKIESDKSLLPWPPFHKPIWFFTDQEFDFIKKNYSENSVLFFPFSSAFSESSRNIDISIINACSTFIPDMTVVHGGRLHESPPMIKSGIKVLWENHNCFDDNYGMVVGKILALASLSKLSIHGYSGSFLIPVGFDKPFLMLTPRDKIGVYPGFKNSVDLFKFHYHTVRLVACTSPCAFCITDNHSVIQEAMNLVLSGKSGIFDKEWTFLK